MKKIISIVLFLCCFWGNTEAQMSPREYMYGFQIGIGYNQSTFINSQFGQMIKDDIAKRNFGTNLNLRFTALPFIIDLSVYNSLFKVENNPKSSWTYADTAKVRHAGLELGVSTPVLRSKYVVPYLGLAYQNGFLGVNVNTLGEADDGVDDDDISVIKIDDFLWKAGVMINFGRNFNIIGEYKQSFDAKAENAYGQLAIILSYRFLTRK